jgi:ribulose kinase
MADGLKYMTESNASRNRFVVNWGSIIEKVNKINKEASTINKFVTFNLCLWLLALQSGSHQSRRACTAKCHMHYKMHWPLLI